MGTPCVTWADEDTVTECAAAVSDESDPDLVTLACNVASAWLYRLSGEQFAGLCSETVRPVPQWHGWHHRRPMLESFDSRTGTFGFYRGWGRRENTHEVSLGNYPVRAVSQVKIDGAVLATSSYRVDDNRWLVRTDGNPWPTANDMTKAATEAGTWSVSFTYGQDPPADGVHAANVMACELVKSKLRPEECRLPDRVATVSRQGLTMTMLDPFMFFSNGYTGLPEADLFILAVNPQGARRPSAVMSPDIGRAVRRTG